jgi:hypothetical protein
MRRFSSKLENIQKLRQLISAQIQSGDLSLVRVVELLGISQHILLRRLRDAGLTIRK